MVVVHAVGDGWGCVCAADANATQDVEQQLRRLGEELEHGAGSQSGPSTATGGCTMSH